MAQKQILEFSMKRLALLVIGLISLAVQPVHAHTRLSAATPADAEITTAAPEEIVLEFSANVRLLSVKLANVDGAMIELGPVPEKIQTLFTLPIMVGLTPGDYVVSWRVVGADTHAVSGSLSFIVTDTETVASH
jgi:methionine-rich copper-binding protein CopC